MGALNLTKKRCADCGLKVPTCGLPGDKRRRWCDACARNHEGARSMLSPPQLGCEDCHLKQRPTYGLPSEWRRRWCATCAKAHAGARDLTSRLRKDCGLKQPIFGIPSEGRQRRWCAACAVIMLVGRTIRITVSIIMIKHLILHCHASIWA